MNVSGRRRQRPSWNLGCRVEHAIFLKRLGPASPVSPSLAFYQCTSAALECRPHFLLSCIPYAGCVPALVPAWYAAPNQSTPPLLPTFPPAHTRSPPCHPSLPPLHNTGPPLPYIKHHVHGSLPSLLHLVHFLRVLLHFFRRRGGGRPQWVLHPHSLHLDLLHPRASSRRQQTPNRHP